MGRPASVGRRAFCMPAHGGWAMASFLTMAELAEVLAGTGSRLSKRALIAEAIGAAEAGSPRGEEAGLFAQYLAGLPFAEADGRKLGAGGALLSGALLRVTGAGQPALTAAYRRHGDLGASAGELLTGRDGERGVGAGVPLPEVRELFAGMAAAPTTAARAALLDSVLGRMTAVEVKYLLKLMLGDMRIGVKQSLVEEAIAVAAGAEVGAVRHAVMLEADLAGAVGRAFAGTLGEARMRLFHPLGFMLASPVDTPEEAVDRFTAKPKKVVEPKVRKGRSRKAGAEEVASPAVESEPSVEREELAGPGSGEDPEAFGDVAVLDTIATPGEVEADAELAEAALGMGGAAAAGAGVQALLEDKYDGMRAQVHCGDGGQPGRVAIYSRNREDVTASFPDLEEALGRVGDLGGLILDGEILGWDFGTAGGEEKALPFAVMAQRIGRKKVDNALRREVPAVFMAFDLLYSDGSLRLEEPLQERRRRLEEIIGAIDGVARSPIEIAEMPKTPARRRGKSDQAGLFEGSVTTEDPGAAIVTAEGVNPGVRRVMLSPARLVQSADEIDRAYAEARARANEGVMLKAAGSVYQPGRRGLAWVKLKRELATLDVVITGVEYGSGRKAQLLSDYTFAVRGEGGELLNVGKAYSGVTDAEILELTEWCKAHTLEDHGHFRTVEPAVVLEVAFNNVMRSDRHASGFALRFPRIVHLRRDKPVEEIDTVARVEEVYASQVDRPAES